MVVVVLLPLIVLAWGFRVNPCTGAVHNGLSIVCEQRSNPMNACPKSGLGILVFGKLRFPSMVLLTTSGVRYAGSAE